jgi:hypothetical protein
MHMKKENETTRLIPKRGYQVRSIEIFSKIDSSVFFYHQPIMQWHSFLHGSIFIHHFRTEFVSIVEVTVVEWYLSDTVASKQYPTKQYATLGFDYVMQMKNHASWPKFCYLEMLFHFSLLICPHFIIWSLHSQFLMNTSLIISS